jgi:hypothetical protein
MVQVVSLVDGGIYVEELKHELRLVVTAQLADNTSIVDINFHFSDQSGARICEVRYAAPITNPIDLAAIGISSLTAYGLCLGTRYVWESWTIVKRTYEEVSKKQPGARTPTERAHDTINLLPEKSDEFLKAGKRLGKECFHFVAGAIGGKVAGF